MKVWNSCCDEIDRIPDFKVIGEMSDIDWKNFGERVANLSKLLVDKIQVRLNLNK